MTEAHPQPQRSFAARLVALLAPAYLALVCIVNLSALHRPSAGFAVEIHGTGQVQAVAVTTAAKEATHGLRGQLSLLAVNGTSVLELSEDRLPELLGLLDERPGAENRFQLRSRDGQLRDVTLEAMLPSGELIASAKPVGLLWQLSAVLFFLTGLFVWWKRPEEPGARPLLYIGTVAVFAWSFVCYHDSASRALSYFGKTAFFLFAPASLNLSLRITGLHARRWARWTLRLSIVGGIACGIAAGAPGWLPVDLGRLPWEVGAALMVLTLSAAVYACWKASRPSRPVAFRRRAKDLGHAMLLAFLVPTLSLPIGPQLPVWVWMINAALVTSFPIMLGYSMVHHGLFDLRFSVGRGAAYMISSTLLLAAYVGLVFSGVHLVGMRLDNPWVVGVATTAFVVLLGFVQIRVQGKINRLIFRSRYIYASAVTEAAQALTRERSLDGIAGTLGDALMNQMQLRGAAVALRRSATGPLRTQILGNHPDPETNQVPESLPSDLWPGQFAPLQRAIELNQLVSAYDTDQTTSLRPSSPVPGPNSELRLRAVSDQSARSQPGVEVERADFWERFGLVALVPLVVGGQGSEPERAMGALFLGSKLDGTRLNQNDEELLRTLANQAAIAADNALAFSEIGKLKDGLEHKVAARTAELSDALEQLGKTQGQLLEKEKQAMLGRLAAGITHEVNTPLGALASSADTLTLMLERCRNHVSESVEQTDAQASDSEAVARSRKLLRATASYDQLRTNVQSSTQRIRHLLSTLEQFVNLDSSEKQVSDIRDGLRSAVVLMGPSLGSATVHQNLGPDAALVSCFPARLNQVFVNLLRNAATAVAGSPSPSIEIQLHLTDEEVLIEIIDNGCGISAEELKDLFDFGFSKQGDRVRLQLGLATSKQALDQIGGTIDVQSAIDHGTTVRLRLPRVLSSASSSPDASMSPPAA